MNFNIYFLFKANFDLSDWRIMEIDDFCKILCQSTSRHEQKLNFYFDDSRFLNLGFGFFGLFCHLICRRGCSSFVRVFDGQ